MGSIKGRGVRKREIKRRGERADIKLRGKGWVEGIFLIFRKILLFKGKKLVTQCN